MNSSERRIVVTGMGAVTAYGSCTKKLIDGALTGVNTIHPIRGFNPHGLPATIASEVDANLLKDTPNSLHSKSSRMAWIAAQEALHQSGLNTKTDSNPIALSAAIGWSNPSNELLESDLPAKKKLTRWQEDPSYREAQPGISAKDLYHAIGCTGPMLTDHAACAAGLHAFVHAARLIQSGRVSACLAGASDSRVNPVDIISYARLGALNTEDNDDATRASRPFNSDRKGFVVGEGAGFLMLESLASAQARGAEVLAELTGWALSNDAENLTDPIADGSRATQCILHCFHHAGISPEEIDYINAHGTSTLNNDHMECMTYSRIWKDQDSPAISATKSMIGHLSMASAAVESIVTLGALQQGVLPPTRNFSDRDPVTEDLEIIGSEPVKRSIHTALKTAYGFGGQNAAVLWNKWSP